MEAPWRRGGPNVPVRPRGLATVFGDPPIRLQGHDRPVDGGAALDAPVDGEDRSSGTRPAPAPCSRSGTAAQLDSGDRPSSCESPLLRRPTGHDPGRSGSRGGRAPASPVHTLVVRTRRTSGRAPRNAPPGRRLPLREEQSRRLGPVAGHNLRLLPAPTRCPEVGPCLL